MSMYGYLFRRLLGTIPVMLVALAAVETGVARLGGTSTRASAITASALVVLVLAAAGALLAQAAPKAQASPALEKILNRMDETAAKFRAAQADFVWEQFQSVVKETDTQKGKVYFRWATKDLQMMANIQDPTQKNVLYSDGKVHGVDEKALRKKARELAAAAVQRAGLHEEGVETTTTLYDNGN